MLQQQLDRLRPNGGWDGSGIEAGENVSTGAGPAGSLPNWLFMPDPKGFRRTLRLPNQVERLTIMEAYKVYNQR